MNIEETDEFEIECLGEKEEFVYDIEVEKNHNFFANRICVHNSAYIKMDGFVKKFPKITDKQKQVDLVGRICKEIISPFIDEKYEELAEYLNCYSQKMEMKRESIADRGIWTAKKRYALNVYDNEGVRYSEPQIKITGIEVQRSSTPKVCRDHLKKALKIILTQDELTLIDYIEEFRKEFHSYDPEQIAFPRGVNGMTKYADKDSIFSKGTPIHVRGALLYNHLIKEHKLTKKYPLIVDGDKIKFLYLKEPNTIHSNTFAFSSVIPKELDIVKCVDYDMQFQKSFLDPITNITSAIGWKHENSNDLSDLFS